MALTPWQYTAMMQYQSVDVLLSNSKLKQGKEEECISNLKIAAELAMNSGVFKFQERVQEKIDSLVV